MSVGMEQTPFLKDLVCSDRKLREKALESLTKYLTSGRQFSELELLKIWKGLFFCMWHTDRPVPQQRLARELAALLQPLSSLADSSPYRTFLIAFWTTMCREWPGIDALRLDKFLRLVRFMIRSSLANLGSPPNEELLTFDIDLIDDMLMERDTRIRTPVPDGLKYHIMDVWVDELGSLDQESDSWGRTELLSPLVTVEKKGKNKTIRGRASDALEDERLRPWASEATKTGAIDIDQGSNGSSDEGEWGGLGD
ncbi:hypothetical protein MMC25_007814 [Agyrium rufum]|nr:hypothetical protein [Agyrium rufum]